MTQLAQLDLRPAKPVPVASTIIHLEGCECRICEPPFSVRAAAVCAIAGCATGNAIAFAYDWHAAWHALSAMVASLLGAR